MFSRETAEFERCARELLRSFGNGTPKVLQSEVDAIRAMGISPSEQLKALVSLTRPRFAYEWQQAGGGRGAYADVTPTQIEEARTFHRARIKERQENIK